MIIDLPKQVVASAHDLHTAHKAVWNHLERDFGKGKLAQVMATYTNRADDNGTMIYTIAAQKVKLK
jgi:hypothetical protein